MRDLQKNLTSIVTIYYYYCCCCKQEHLIGFLYTFISNEKTCVYVINEVVMSAYVGWGIGISEKEVSCLTTGELVFDGVIHVLPVTDVVPLDVCCCCCWRMEILVPFL